MYTISKNSPITAAEPIHQVEAGNHGGGDGNLSTTLGKQWIAEQLGIPVEAAQNYTLLAYVGEHGWCIMAACAGNAE
jgi:hypothetical protein